MSSRLPPLHALEAFVAVARHKSFAYAADELCVTPSAISHRIKALEAHFQATLFRRHRSTVQMTQQGTLIFEAVITALAALDSAHQRLKSLQHKVVRLAVGQGFARNWLIERLAGFYRIHRDIHVDINGARAARAKLDALRNEDADVAIHIDEQDAEARSLERVRILDCLVFPVCSPEYRTTLPEPDNPQKLLEADLLRVVRQPWKHWFKAAGVVCDEPDHGPLFSDSGLMLDAAVRGQGIALARDVLIRHDLDMGRLQRLCTVATSCTYYAIYLKESLRRPEVAAFVHWLSGMAAQSSSEVRAPLRRVK